LNRREAIRKLAAGGAVAAGASVVLSSHDVAFAASPPDTGLTNVPGSTEPLPIAFMPNTNGTVTVGDATSPACTSGGGPTVTYSWKVNSFSFSGGNRHLLVVNAANLSQIIHDTSGSSGYSSPNTGHPAVELRKTNNGRKRQIKPLESGDSYSISVIVTWQCSGANSALEAEYTLMGMGSNPPAVGVSSYDII
jgi:hypothetical protein